MLDEQVLEEATRLGGQKTYSATVNLALRLLVSRARSRRIVELFGAGLWEGDLGDLRRDSGGATEDRRSRKKRPGTRGQR